MRKDNNILRALEKERGISLGLLTMHTFLSGQKLERSQAITTSWGLIVHPGAPSREALPIFGWGFQGCHSPSCFVPRARPVAEKVGPRAGEVVGPDLATQVICQVGAGMLPGVPVARTPVG